MTTQSRRKKPAGFVNLSPCHRIYTSQLLTLFFKCWTRHLPVSSVYKSRKWRFPEWPPYMIIVFPETVIVCAFRGAGWGPKTDGCSHVWVSSGLNEHAAPIIKIALPKSKISMPLKQTDPSYPPNMYNFLPIWDNVWQARAEGATPAVSWSPFVRTRLLYHLTKYVPRQTT